MSRLVSYKRVDLIVRAFNDMPGKELIVVGDGPEFDAFARLAGPNVTMVGYQPDKAATHYMENARAFMFAAAEDFGIVPVEAQACGTPVVAYGRGGVTETVVPGETGVFFQEQEVGQVKGALANSRTFALNSTPRRCGRRRSASTCRPSEQHFPGSFRRLTPTSPRILQAKMLPPPLCLEPHSDRNYGGRRGLTGLSPRAPRCSASTPAGQGVGPGA